MPATADKTKVTPNTKTYIKRGEKTEHPYCNIQHMFKYKLSYVPMRSTDFEKGFTGASGLGFDGLGGFLDTWMSSS